MPDTYSVLPSISAMARAVALAAAVGMLERAVRHERWGCSAQDYQWQAIPLLRAAGRGDLADRLDDDAWGADLPDVLAEVTDALSCYRALGRREEG